MGICVLACSPSSLVAAGGERIHERALGEPPRLREQVGAAGDPRERRERVAHAAVLGREHALERVVVEVRGDAEPPVGHALRHPQRAGGSGVLVRVQQPAERLVQVVERHPPALEVEGVGLDPALRDGAAELPAVGHAAEPAVAGRLLAALENVEHVLEPGEEPRVAGRRVQLRERGEQVPADVAVEADGLPAAVRRHGGVEPGLAEVGREQPVGVHAEHVLDVGELRVPERPVAQPHGGERERPGGARAGGGGARGGGGDGHRGPLDGLYIDAHNLVQRCRRHQGGAYGHAAEPRRADTSRTRGAR
ncbi:hypothetical protein WDV94_13475 [Clavibacter tessellarius]